MKVKDALNKINMFNIKKLSDDEIKELDANVRRSVTQRRNAFSKAGLFDEFTPQFKKYVPSAKEIIKRVKEAGQQMRTARKEIEENILKALAWMRGDMADVKKVQKRKEEFRQQLKDRFGISDVTDKQLKQYLKFMNSMQKRFGDKWAYDSDLAYKLAYEALRLNINPETFLANYDYWASHLEELENIETPLAKRGKTISATDARRMLNFEKINSWKKNRR